MPKTHRLTDANTGGGVIDATPQGSVYANNLLVSVNGAQGTAHAKCDNNNAHCYHRWVTTGGGPTVFAENIPVNKEGDPDSCNEGHVRTGGSPNVYNDAFVGGGAMFDNNPPYSGSPPPGAQPSPPAGYENNTAATVYVFANQDVPEEINPPPAEVNYEPLAQVLAELNQATPNAPPIQACTPFSMLPATFNWIDEPYPDFPTWAAATPLSANFTVWDMCNGAVGRHEFTTSVTQASGATQKTILLNMCHHANIVLEPMLAAYGSFTITSGFRQASGGSQHNVGQATDIQFLGLHTYPGSTKSVVRQAYFDRAKLVRDGINFDQLILEWFGTNPWLHVSSNASNHRGSVLTQVAAVPTSSFNSGLILMDV